MKPFEQDEKSTWYRPSKLFPGQASIMWLFPFNVLSHLCWKLDEQSITQILPSIEEEFEISSLNAEWYSTAFYLASAGAAIPFGKLGEKYGQPILIIVCLLFYATLEILQFFTKSFAILIVLRVFIGVFISGMVCNKNALLTKYPAKENSGLSVSVSLMINNFVIIFIPYICGVTIDHLSWKWNMVFASIASVLCIVCLLFYRNNPFDTKLKFDLLGSLLLMLSVGSFCSIFVLLARELYIFGGVMAPVFLLILFLFLFAEKKASDPVLPPYLMKNPVSDIFISYSINYINEGGVLFIYPEVMKYYNYTATRVGLVITISGVFLFAMSLAIPLLQKKFTNFLLLSILNLTAFTATILELLFIRNVVANSILFALENVLFMSVMVVLYKSLLLSVPEKYASRVSGFPTTGRTVGNSISLCLFTSLQTIVENRAHEPGQNEIIAFESCCGIIIFFSMVQLIVLVLRIGNTSAEQAKSGFSEKLVHDLRLPMEMEENVTAEASVLENEM